MGVSLTIGSKPGPAVSLEEDIMIGPVRVVAEGAGALVMWCPSTRTAIVRPALAPEWTLLAPLGSANAGWPTTRQMAQWKLDALWAHALRRQVDPLLMVAILLHEDTGSFDTNANNAGEYNGNGPQGDWLLDVDLAVGHVMAKLRAYNAAWNVGFGLAASQVNLEGNVIQFINWPGPLPDFRPTWGAYAQHGEWWRGVESFYEELGGNVEALSLHARRRSDTATCKVSCVAVTDRADLCSDLTGTVPVPGVVTWIR